MEHWESQRSQHDQVYGHGSHSHVITSDPLVRYVTRWRLKEALRRLRRSARDRITPSSKVLIMCAGEGLGGTVLCDLEFEDVTVSYISSRGVEQAISRELRIGYERMGRWLGGGVYAVSAIRSVKRMLDAVAPAAGSQFCGLILKKGHQW